VNFKLSPDGNVDLGFAVQSFMAVSAQGDEVQIVVVALLAPQLLVVDMQILLGTANLAFPPIALQYLSSELVVRFGISRKRGRLGRIGFMKPARLLHAEKLAVVRQAGI
jgi:hypothetical protein